MKIQDGICPKCGSTNIEKSHNILNLGVGNEDQRAAQYYFDFPFGPKYKCKDCGLKSDNCFIATTIYGDVNAYEVRVLRNFRDNILKKNDLGKAFVKFYYSGAGKSIANVIHYFPFAIPAIRKGLDFIIKWYITHKNKMR